MDVGYSNGLTHPKNFFRCPVPKWVSSKFTASLTASPAERSGFYSHSGRIENGMDAGLVVLHTDPRQDATAFSGVQFFGRSHFLWGTE